jgi:hypothetical protein
MFTYAQKQIIIHLLNGSYLIKVKSINTKYTYRLYEGKMNPVLKVKESDMSSLFTYFLKEDKLGRLTLNLKTIRQERGNAWIKKAYKLSKQNLTIIIKKKKHERNISNHKSQSHPSLF